MTHLIEAFLFPPGFNLFLALMAALLWWRGRRRGAWRLMWVSFALLYVLSTPLCSVALLQSLQQDVAIRPQEAARLSSTPTAPQAIVILGGGRLLGAPEYGGDTVSRSTLERLRFGAQLARATSLPVLVSGGAPMDEGVAEGRLMAQVLIEDYGVPVRWIEEKSFTTAENAKNSAKILQKSGINHVYVVTHALHMRRARLAFEPTGLTFTAAPTSYTFPNADDRGYMGLRPSAHALEQSRQALHEMVGWVWYRLRG